MLQAALASFGNSTGNLGGFGGSVGVTGGYNAIQTSTLANIALGGGTNVINTDFLFVGRSKSGGTINFQGASGSLAIRGSAGGASKANPCWRRGRGAPRLDGLPIPVLMVLPCDLLPSYVSYV